MNRRQLFTRLSAAFLAPLVKWLPKKERHLSLDAGVRFVKSPLVVCASDGMWVVTNAETKRCKFHRVTVSGQPPIPREEA